MKTRAWGDGFRERTGRGLTRVNPHTVPLAPAEAEYDVGGIDHYWHPERDGVEQAPDDFQRDLALISPDVRAVRPPAGAPMYFKRAWLIFMRCERVTHYLSPGWLMLIDWRNQHGEPMPLDNRVFSYLYSISAMKFGTAKKYWDHCVAEKQREDAAKERAYTNERRDRQREYRQYTGIKNIGAGSKFARHHDGTSFPGKNALAMHLQNRRRTIPSEVAKDEAQQLEQRRAARGF
jgi:hypothetical protein